ncbi:flagellin N-terminal helical domain-containing protein [Legionella sp. CNM-4043-24]|uniref:flagellin N-terminal helical domain-containing protein n=1 Tax=Legionella sp. CNM-4043-24 TaxID=3421646 RepID=UPI00403AA11D
MAITINTNTSSLMAQQSLGRTQDQLAQATNRLSTGRRINQAKDDAAGNAIAAGMTAQIRAVRQGGRNGNDGISLIQTAEGGLNQTLSLLQRMRELASQASTGTYTTSDLANLDTEYQSLMTEIDRVAATLDFNGTFLMNAATTISVQVGSNNTANDRIDIALIDSTSATLAVTGDVTSNANAQAALDLLDDAITTVTTGLAGLGASHSKIEAAVNGNLDRVVNLEASRSRIMDADFAEESAKLAQLQILQQSGAAMLSQANSSGQIVLKLLQG